jgi:hypothetical protein
MIREYLRRLRVKRERDRVLDDLCRQMRLLDERARIGREKSLAAKAARHASFGRPCLPVRFCAFYDGRRWWGC